MLPGRCGRPGHRCGTAGMHPGCDASVWKLRSRRGKNHGLHESQLCAALPGMSAGDPGRFWRASGDLSSSSLPSSSIFHAPTLPPLRLNVGRLISLTFPFWPATRRRTRACTHKSAMSAFTLRSGHCSAWRQCPLCGQKRTSERT